MTTSTESAEEFAPTKLRGPNKHHVIMLNDDSTPMEFVVQVLITIFRKTNEQATEVMLEIHEKGKAIAGTYMYEVAEQKQLETTNAARAAGYPLSTITEEAE
ncbi:ATP-dependent Clp protease adaptor ClpS [bacterium]|nr:ATP-dependent Clp protease adaptor ClpS [bacterium]MDB4128500.1 ATP-dependent Clp protease adaptor ClpS [bacterium]MDC1257300.1 ATP-dependent Clp protease adaptor ClpS [bacterium]